MLKSTREGIHEGIVAVEARKVPEIPDCTLLEAEAEWGVQALELHEHLHVNLLLLLGMLRVTIEKLEMSFIR